MPRHLATAALAAALGAILWIGSGCSSDGDSNSDAGSELSADQRAACEEYNRVINQWSRDYGTELGEVGQAGANGEEEERQEEAVEAVESLFRSAADDLRTQADATSDPDLSSGLGQAADGLVEIAEQIQTYEDVTEAPELMSDGQFAEGGQQVNDLCAG